MKIVMATQNKGKIFEINKILKDFDAEVLSMADAGLGDLDIDETGATCQENSLIKAETVSRLTNMPAIADDAGLFVDSLNGEPGVYSARYAGEHGNDAANRKKILEKLDGVPEEKRTAAFICVVTLSYPNGKHVAFEGECKGRISFEEAGTEGFGYDSIFIPDEENEAGLTFAQIGVEHKNKFSHRAKALSMLKKYFNENI